MTGQLGQRSAAPQHVLRPLGIGHGAGRQWEAGRAGGMAGIAAVSGALVGFPSSGCWRVANVPLHARARGIARAGTVFLTDNYADRSSNDGYQFEFYCGRCGNGYTSPFQHSATGFGGRLLRLGGDMVGGQIGERAAQLGWDAEFMRDTVRGSTRDKRSEERRVGKECW